MPKTPTIEKTFMAFRPTPALVEAMAALTERDGISASEQIRRALVEWLHTKGVLPDEKKKQTQKRKKR